MISTSAGGAGVAVAVGAAVGVGTGVAVGAGVEVAVGAGGTGVAVSAGRGTAVAAGAGWDAGAAPSSEDGPQATAAIRRPAITATQAKVNIRRGNLDPSICVFCIIIGLPRQKL